MLPSLICFTNRQRKKILLFLFDFCIAEEKNYSTQLHFAMSMKEIKITQHKNKVTIAIAMAKHGKHYVFHQYYRFFSLSLFYPSLSLLFQSKRDGLMRMGSFIV